MIKTPSIWGSTLCLLRMNSRMHVFMYVTCIDSGIRQRIQRIHVCRHVCRKCRRIHVFTYSDMYVDSRMRQRIQRIHVFRHVCRKCRRIHVFMYADMYIDSRIRQRIQRIHVFRHVCRYCRRIHVFMYADMYVDGVDVFLVRTPGFWGGAACLRFCKALLQGSFAKETCNYIYI